jgi:hypothetical protein
MRLGVLDASLRTVVAELGPRLEAAAFEPADALSALSLRLKQSEVDSVT